MREVFRKKWVKVFLGIVIVILGAAGAVALYASTKYQKVAKTDIDQDKIAVNQDMEDPVGQEEKEVPEYVNVALFGVQSNRENNGEVQSDAVIILSLNRSTGQVKLLSVYGNTQLMDEDKKPVAAKNIYSEGPERAVKILNRNLDLNIEKYASIDYMAMVYIVDAIGGIEVDVKEDEIIHIAGYTAGINAMLGTNSPEVKTTGLQRLDGIQAVSYCIIRATDGGDVTRGERQKTVMTKLTEGLKGIDITKIDPLIDSVFPMIETNFELSELVMYGKDVKKYSVDEPVNFPYNIIPLANNGVQDPREEAMPVVAENYRQDVVKFHEEFFPEMTYTPSENFLSPN